MSSRIGALPTPGLARTAGMKLSDEVARVLLRDIRRQGLCAGARISSERDLAMRLGVGRSTIREAINGLAMLGALEMRHGQGTFVRDPDVTLEVPNTVAAVLARGVTRDLFEARRLVEVHTTRLAAERRTHHDVIELAATVSEQTWAVVNRAPTVEFALQFHVRLARASQNEILARMVECFARLLAERRPALESAAGYCEWELEQYRGVLAAVGDGHADRAAAHMSAHLDTVAAWHERLAAADEPVGAP
jgi:GntR family transcriptional repressor for pyruvate dehydrogenase complex